MISKSFGAQVLSEVVCGPTSLFCASGPDRFPLQESELHAVFRHDPVQGLNSKVISLEVGARV